MERNVAEVIKGGDVDELHERKKRWKENLAMANQLAQGTKQASKSLVNHMETQKRAKARESHKRKEDELHKEVAETKKRARVVEKVKALITDVNETVPPVFMVDYARLMTKGHVRHVNCKKGKVESLPVGTPWVVPDA